jgi:hypothetical protein
VTPLAILGLLLSLAAALLLLSMLFAALMALIPLIPVFAFLALVAWVWHAIGPGQAVALMLIASIAALAWSIARSGKSK